MMRKFLSILTIAATLFVCRPMHAAPITTNTVDSLWNKLQFVKTPEDSVRILYDIYDATLAQKSTVVSRKENQQVLDMMYNTSLNAGDTTRAYAAVRNLVSIARYDIPFINYQQKRISKLPSSIDKKETDTYLNLQRHIYATRDTTISHAIRQENFHKMTKQLDKIKHSSDIYDRLNFNFALMLYGANLIHPKQLESYMKDLNKLVEQTRAEGYPLKYLFYTTAPIIYDDNQEWENSIETDRKLLLLLDKLEKEAKEDNRQFVSYDYERFVAYRRMLSNFDLLKEGEPEQIYEKLNQLMNKLPDEQITPIDHMTVEASWNMYQRNYQTALELLRGVLSSKRFSDKPKYIMLYINAASALGAYDDLEKGQDLYIELIKKRARDASDTEYNRMRIAFDIDSLEDTRDLAAKFAGNAEKEVEQANKKIEVFYILAGIGVLIFLFIILIIFYVANRRNRRIAQQLKVSNAKLTTERDSLKRTQSELIVARDRVSQAMRQKTEFIHNIGHEISEPAKTIVGFSQLIVDSIPSEKRKYLNGFVDIINHNSEILQRIVGDILDTADVEGTVTNVTVTHFYPDKICQLVADNFRPRLNPNQKIVVDKLNVIGTPVSNELGIDSDASRLEQILINLLANSVKFCEKGTITLSPEINFDTKMLSIAVTDEGPGIAKGKEDIIFERFEKVGKYNNGLGLGLYVSKELAHMLGGDIKLDTSYTKGARMIVTIPINIRPNNV